MKNQETTNETLIGGSGLNAVLERMTITKSEYVELINSATHGRYVGCSFGQVIDLLPTEDNRWAFEMVNKMRSNIIGR
jgi:hypothetical protein